MTLEEFAGIVRTMRRDQKDFDEHRTSGAKMKARWSEKQVDDALADMPEPVAVEETPDGFVEVKT